MKEKVRLIALLFIDAFMTVCLCISIVKREAPTAVITGFAVAFTTYSLLSILVPNVEKEFKIYKRKYASHLDGVFVYDNRYLTRLIRMILQSEGDTPRLGLVFASKLLKAAKTEREKAVVYYFCGMCNKNAQSYPAAKEYFAKAIECDGNYTEAKVVYAEILMLLSDYDEAEVLLSEENRKEVENPELTCLYAKIKLIDGESESAKVIFSEVPADYISPLACNVGLVISVLYDDSEGYEKYSRAMEKLGYDKEKTESVADSVKKNDYSVL